MQLQLLMHSCVASPNFGGYSIPKTELDEFLCSKMPGSMPLVAISPRTREPAVPGGCSAVFLKVGVTAEIGVALLAQIVVAAEALEVSQGQS